MGFCIENGWLCVVFMESGEIVCDVVVICMGVCLVEFVLFVGLFVFLEFECGYYV